jgi:tetratricopeptide (TPR) repeat protein
MYRSTGGFILGRRIWIFILLHTLALVGYGQNSNAIYKQKNFVKGVQYYQAGQKTKAIEQFRACLKAVPGHPGAYYYAGVLRYDKNQLSMAEYNFLRSFEYPEKGFNSYFYLGRIYQKKKQWEKAKGAYGEYIRRTESASGKKTATKYLSQVERALSTTVSRKSEKTSSIASSNSGIQVLAVDSSLLENPMMAWEEKGIAYFLPDTSHHTNQTELHEVLEFVHQRKWDTGIRKLRRLTLKHSGSSIGYYASINLASLYLQKELYQKALEEAMNVSKYIPVGTLKQYTHIVEARSYIGLKQWSFAKNALEHVETKSPFFKREVALSYAEVEQGEGNSPQAIPYLEEAMKWTSSSKDKMEIQYQKAQIYLEMGEKEQAVEEYQKVVHLKNEEEGCVDSTASSICSRSYIQIADVWYQLKKWEKASKAYEYFTENFPNNKHVPWSLYQMANAAKQKGDYQLALDQYRKVIEDHPKSYWSSQAKFKLEDAIWEYEYQGVLN